MQTRLNDLPSFDRARCARQSAARNMICQTVHRMMKCTGCISRAKKGLAETESAKLASDDIRINPTKPLKYKNLLQISPLVARMCPVAFP